MIRQCLMIASLTFSALAVSACQTAPDGTRQPDVARIERDVAAARAAYCALPEETRAAIRAKATKGLTVIVCD